jgi:hypothetical protein
MTPSPSARPPAIHHSSSRYVTASTMGPTKRPMIPKPMPLAGSSDRPECPQRAVASLHDLPRQAWQPGPVERDLGRRAGPGPGRHRAASRRAGPPVRRAKAGASVPAESREVAADVTRRLVAAHRRRIEQPGLHQPVQRRRHQPKRRVPGLDHRLVDAREQRRPQSRRERRAAAGHPTAAGSA